MAFKNKIQLGSLMLKVNKMKQRTLFKYNVLSYIGDNCFKPSVVEKEMVLHS